LNPASRFHTASSALSLRSLLRKAKYAGLASLGTALGAHALLTTVERLGAERTVAKPLTTQFIKREPRLTKPLEMKKTPRPKRRQMRRTMVSVKARVERGGTMASVRSPRLLQSLARPVVSVARASSGETPQMEMEALAEQILGTRESEHTLDLSLEMVDVEALDTGRYQAMVIQDPTDKRQIKGYLHLAVAFPLSVYHRYGADYNNVNWLMVSLRRLVDRLNEWTNINASITSSISFDSAELFLTPWVYLSLNFAFEPTESETANLGEYLLGGGFLYFEGSNWHAWDGERALFRFVAQALESQGHRQGVDWEFEFIPKTHPIFHCYYDFPDGTPVGDSVVSKFLWQTGRDDDIEPYSKGVQVDSRLVAFNTNQGYSGAWRDWNNPVRTSSYVYLDPTIPFRFGINTIIFALTQEGSITRRAMDSVR